MPRCLSSARRQISRASRLLARRRLNSTQNHLCRFRPPAGAPAPCVRVVPVPAGEDRSADAEEGLHQETARHLQGASLLAHALFVLLVSQPSPLLRLAAPPARFPSPASDPLRPSADIRTRIRVSAQMCEDLEDTEGLQNMARLVRGILLLNDAHLLDTLLGEEFIMDVVRWVLCYSHPHPRASAGRVCKAAFRVVARALLLAWVIDAPRSLPFRSLASLIRSGLWSTIRSTTRGRSTGSSFGRGLCSRRLCQSPTRP